MLKSMLRVATKGPLPQTRWKPWRVHASHAGQATGVSHWQTRPSSYSQQQHPLFRHNWTPSLQHGRAHSPDLIRLCLRRRISTDYRALRVMSSTPRLPHLCVVHRTKSPCTSCPKITASCQAVSTRRTWAATKSLRLSRLLPTLMRNTMTTVDSHLAKSPQIRSAHSVRRLAMSWSRSSAVAHQERTATYLIPGSSMLSIGIPLVQAERQ